jgi:hypothetical protein
MLLAAGVFAHGMAELGDDGLAELGDHDVEGERRGCRVEDAVAGALGDWTRRQSGVESGQWRGGG